LLPRHALAFAILAVIVLALAGFAWRTWRRYKLDMDTRWGVKRRRRRD
jgi:hypothetical protein